MTAERSLGALGIPEEAITPDFGTTPHGKLANMLKERIERSARIFSSASGNQPIDYRAKSVDLVAELQNSMANLYDIFRSESIPAIFSSQEEYEQFAKDGIMSLSPEQAQTAVRIMESEKAAIEAQDKRHGFRKKKIQRAERTGDLASYLMWQVEAEEKGWTYTYEKNALWQQILCGEKTESNNHYSRRIQKRKPQFVSEAKLVQRMHKELEKLPETGKIKVSIMRLPAEVNRMRPPRALVYTPEGTYNRFFNNPQEANINSRTTWNYTDAPCLHHALDSIYRVTRKELPNGQFEPRAFYVTSQSAATNAPDLPESAKRFMEISYADGTEPTPAIRKQYGEGNFSQNPVILKDDIEPNLVYDEGQMHFIIGHDEEGQRITQDEIPYAMDALLGGVSNAYNIPVDQFFRKAA